MAERATGGMRDARTAWGGAVLDESAHQNLLADIDTAVSRCIDAFNLAAEADETELADALRARVSDLQALREAARGLPTRPARWMFARSPRGDARSR